MVGHNPHRIEGKARDAERAHGERMSAREDAMRGLPTEKEVAGRIARDPSRYDAEEMRGGMRRGRGWPEPPRRGRTAVRPGVRSRIHEAEDRQED